MPRVLPILAVLGLILVAMGAIRSRGSTAAAVPGEQSSHREVLGQLERDLTFCSMEPDPVTDRPRFEIFIDESGRQAIRYRKIVGARLASGELEPIWSGFIEVHRTPEGRVARTEDGETTDLGSGIADLSFAVTTAGRFQVLCTTRSRDPEDGHVVELTHEELILPKN